MNRVPALGLVAALLVAGGVADRVVGRPRQADGTGPANGSPLGVAALQPAAGSASALDSTWFCAGPAPRAGVFTDSRIVVANPDPSRRLRGTVTLLTDQGEARAVALDVSPFGRQVVRPQSVGVISSSAIVSLDAAQAGVELVELGPLGSAISPCASAASNHWFFAEGVTTKDANESLLVFNPFPGDAVVDVSFVTELGASAPEALAAVRVAPHTTRVIDVSGAVQRREAVSSTVTARAGSVVVSRLQTFDGSAGPRAPHGVSLALGSPSPGDLWYFPEGYVVDGVVDRFQVFNPSAQEAKVEVDLALEQGQAAPIQLSVPPNGRTTINANDEHRIPHAVGYATTFRAIGGVGVVVERTVEAGPPSPRAGVAIMLGSRVAATRWLLPSGEADDTADEWLVVQAPGGP
ncbi:MAG: DUF5719 family protein, partial [Acidimicrobiales bacterium]